MDSFFGGRGLTGVGQKTGKLHRLSDYPGLKV